MPFPPASTFILHLALFLFNSGNSKMLLFSVIVLGYKSHKADALELYFCACCFLHLQEGCEVSSTTILLLAQGLVLRIIVSMGHFSVIY